MNELVIDKFAGYSGDSNPEGNPPIVASALQNVEITDTYREVKGSIGCRKLKDTACVAAKPIDGLHDYRKKTFGTHEPLVLCDGDLYKWTGSAYTEIKNSGATSLNATAAKYMQAVTIQEKAFCVNSEDVPWYYDGSYWAAWGKEAPIGGVVGTGTTSYPNATTGAAGNPEAGWREAFFTLASAAASPVDESAPSRIVRFETTSALAFTIGSGYSTDGQANVTRARPAWAPTHVRFWLTLANDPCTFYLAGTTPFPASASTVHVTLAYDSTDVTLAGNTVWADFGGPPNKVHGIFLFGPEFSRIGVYGSPEFPSRLWWTNPDEPMKFTDSNWADFGSDDGDRIQACAQLRGGVVILKRHTTWALFGASSTTFHTGQQSDKIGCAARYSLVVHQGKGYWLSEHGVYASTGAGEPEPIGEGKVRKWVENLNWATGSDLIRGCYVPELDQIWWTVPYGTAITKSNRVLVLDLRSGEFLIRAWLDDTATPEDINVTAMCTQLASGQESTLIGFGVNSTSVTDEAGFVAKLTAGEYNWLTIVAGTGGFAQDMYWESHWFETGGVITEIEVIHDKQTAGNLTVTVSGVDHSTKSGVTDTEDSAYAQTVTIDMTGAKVYRWPCTMGRRLCKIKVQNSTADQTFAVRKIIVHRAPRGDRRGGY